MAATDWILEMARLYRISSTVVGYGSSKIIAILAIMRRTAG